MMTLVRRPAEMDLGAALAEADRLRAQVASLLETHRKVSSLLVSADTRSGELMKLLVAVRALIESRDAAAAVDSLQDILVNVVGTDDFVIYALARREQALVPIAGQGPTAEGSGPVPLDVRWKGAAAVVPLTVLDRVVGVIVIGSLLPHRGILGGCDAELLGLLGVYAATAIIAADQRMEWSELPQVDA